MSGIFAELHQTHGNLRNVTLVSIASFGVNARRVEATAADPSNREESSARAAGYE